MRAQQTVSEMVVESLARQAQALSERSGQPFEEAIEEVLKTHAGYRLAELADGPHRHEKAAEWQAGLLADRHAQRRAHLRILRERARHWGRAQIVAGTLHGPGRGHGWAGGVPRPVTAEVYPPGGLNRGRTAEATPGKALKA